MKKIGVIDSGLGGLSVVKQLNKMMPNEELIYFGDNGRCPYGNKSEQQIRSYIDDIIHFLKNYELKMLIIACNTASSFLLEELEGKLDFPVLGMVGPGVKMAFEATLSKRVGLMATHRTVETRKHAELFRENQTGVVLYNQACPELVPLIETDERGEQLREAIRFYTRFVSEENIDTLILGCTHYPLIKREIQQSVGPKVSIIDPAIEVVEQAYLQLSRDRQINYKREESDLYFVSGETEPFQRIARKWLDETILVSGIKMLI